MSKYFKFILILCTSTVIVSCRNETNSATEKDNGVSNTNIVILELPDNKAGEVVKEAIVFAGGWETWQEKKTVSYIKEITFLDSLGAVERTVTQQHEYQLKPEFKARISWKDAGDDYVIVNDGRQAFKMKNTEKLDGDEAMNSAWNSSFGSHYVMSMPFKLADEGAILEYKGLDTLVDNTIVHSVKTTYKNGVGSAGGLHTWWYYFDKETHEPVANFLDYGDGYSYTENVTTKNVSGIVLNTLRKGYKTNKNRDLLYTSAVYENKDIKFDTKLEGFPFMVETK